MVLSFAIGVVVFLPFPGWQKLVGFITASSALCYATAPVALWSLRRQDPRRARPFRLKAAVVLAISYFTLILGELVPKRIAPAELFDHDGIP